MSYKGRNRNENRGFVRKAVFGTKAGDLARCIHVLDAYSEFVFFFQERLVSTGGFFFDF